VNPFSLSRFAVPLGILGLVTLLSLNIAAIFAQSPKSTVSTETTPKARIEDGRKAFIQHGCFSCHGFSGQGGRGARLAQSPIPLQAFAQYVRRPNRAMPPFGAQVSDQELADIYAFIKSIPPSPDPKSIPLLTSP
jgi:mono/diheme cytochrome c family protein